MVRRLLEKTLCSVAVAVVAEEEDFLFLLSCPWVALVYLGKRLVASVRYVAGLRVF